MESVGRGTWASGLRRMSPLAVEERGQTIQRRLDYEVGRARRYGGRVSIVAFRPASPTMTDGTWQRFAASVAGSLRDLDTCWIDRARITLVLPETDLTARSHVIDRVLRSAGLNGLDIEALASTFPDEAATTDALVRSVTGTHDARSA